MAFWTNATGFDPKRGYRFTVTLGNMPSGAQWYAKAVKKPALTITEVDHSYLNHKFYYPGRTEWDTVEVTLVDPVSPDAAANTAAILTNAGYHPPNNMNDTTTMSKAAAVASLGAVEIEQIDSQGEYLERWTLWNAFITGVSYGDLSYEDDALTEVTITLRYDWAKLETRVGAETPFLKGQKTFWKV
tara:strand:- start:1257 stop:1817 length:561 start_codon:yes stop_codon:yes gene_type:complete